MPMAARPSRLAYVLGVTACVGSVGALGPTWPRRGRASSDFPRYEAAGLLPPVYVDLMGWGLALGQAWSLP